MLGPISLFIALAFLYSSLYSSASATPFPNPRALQYNEYRQENRPKCNTPLQERHEWRTLSADEKGGYIKAIKCLQSNAAKEPVIPEAKTRFDEFQAHHMKEADNVHFFGQFLPWHRHFIRTYEKLLRDECGYTGSFPYWDWSKDVGPNQSVSDSPVFDPKTGFGGNGVNGTYTLPPANNTDNLIFPEAYVGCVKDGPFADYTLNLGPGKLVTSHCLTRGQNNDMKQYLNSAEVANVISSPNFEAFRVSLEGDINTLRPHNAGHVVIGGEMSNFYSSPGEPLFYLHHANLDRIWWNWQQLSSSRLYEISGPATKIPSIQNVTLDYVLNMKSLGPSVTIRDVMDIHSEGNCYTYV